MCGKERHIYLEKNFISNKNKKNHENKMKFKKKKK